MKKALLLVSLIFSGLYAVDAQWSYKSCGVVDINECTSEEFECLWERATKNVRVGAITTGIGVAGIGTSILMVTLIMGAEIDSGPVSAIFTYLSFGAGIVGVIIGPPIWITGAARKSKLRTNPHYEALNSLSFNLSPTINRNQFNNSYAFGLTASLSF